MGSAGARRAVLMVVDGLRADLVTPELTPHLHALSLRSRRFSGHRSVFPSATRVNSASIATGCLPARHGLMGNAIALPAGDGWRPVSVGPPGFRDEWRAATGRTLWVPVLAERLRGDAVVYSNSSPGAAYMQDPDGFGLLHHRTGTFAPPPGLEPGASPELRGGPLRQSGGVLEGLTYDGAGDAATTERFCAALLADPAPSLWTLWICEPDHSQHELELGSPSIGPSSRKRTGASPSSRKRWRPCGAAARTSFSSYARTTATRRWTRSFRSSTFSSRRI